jgi:N-acetylmuramoyl-L-alanine amidase CwlA
LYQITQDFIVGLPKTPYRNGIGNYEGVVQHCTDSPNHSGGDTPTNEENFERGTYNNAFVHFFVGVENGQAVIRQVADTAYVSYGAGFTANSRFVHLELCMYDDPNLFKIAYDAYVWMSAKILFDRKLGVIDNGTILSHKEVSDDWHETTHQDPIDYFIQHNLTWGQHVQNVQGAYNQMVQTWVNFYTGGYGGDSLARIQTYLQNKGHYFKPTRKDDGTLMFEIGGFLQGGTDYNNMKQFLDISGYWYQIENAWR